MNPDDLLKAAPAIARVAGPFAAAIPFTAIVKRMLGPAADELAEMWRDQVRLYRYERQLKCVEKAEKMAQEAGFTPQAVPPKILFPLLEGASFEENEDLHTMWAALLANAASDMARAVRPSFVSLLRELAADEAALLNAIRDLTEAQEAAKAAKEYMLSAADWREQDHIFTEFRARFPKIAGEDKAAGDERFEGCIQALVTAGLISTSHTGYRLTSRGTTFLTACRAPKPKK
jgi:hypothetical protein